MRRGAPRRRSRRRRPGSRRRSLGVGNAPKQEQADHEEGRQHEESGTLVPTRQVCRAAEEKRAHHRGRLTAERVEAEHLAFTPVGDQTRHEGPTGRLDRPEPEAGQEPDDSERADDTAIAAALLHDIGHYTSEFGADAYLQEVDNIHEEAGARVLEQHFPDRVTAAVRLHVAAKRYLCATNASYFSQLSDASVTSLQLQGGPMSDAEVAEFEKQPHYREALRVRVWDDKAKDPSVTAPDFDHYKPLLKRLVAAQEAP